MNKEYHQRDYDFQRAARLNETWDDMKNKLCVDCKHFRPDRSGTSFHLCEIFAVQSLVTGETHYRSCALAREERGGCDPHGAYWERNDAEKT